MNAQQAQQMMAAMAGESGKDVERMADAARHAQYVINLANGHLSDLANGRIWSNQSGMTPEEIAEDARRAIADAQEIIDRYRSVSGEWKRLRDIVMAE